MARQLAERQEAKAAAERLEDFQTAASIGVSYFLAVRAGRFDQAAEVLAAEQARDQKLGSPIRHWITTCYTAAHAILLGDLDEAEHLAAAALDIGTAAGQPDAFAFYGIQLMHIRCWQGRYGELVPLITAAVAQTPGILTYKSVLAHSTLQAGDSDRAEALLNELAVSAFAFPEDSAQTAGLTEAVVVTTNWKGPTAPTCFTNSWRLTRTKSRIVILASAFRSQRASPEWRQSWGDMTKPKNASQKRTSFASAVG